MTALPVIVGMGGINAAGRTSFHQGYRRIVLDALNAQARSETFLGLATLMNLVRVVDGQLQDTNGNNVEQSDIEGKSCILSQLPTLYSRYVLNNGVSPTETV